MATFGYTSVGGSDINTEGLFRGSLYPLAEESDVESITSYTNITSSKSQTCGIYSGDGSTAIVATTPSTIPASAAWNTLSFGTPHSLSTASYYLGCWAEGGSGGAFFHYDTGGNGAVRPFTTYSAGTIPSPPLTTGGGERYSIYATYTAAPSEEPPTVTTQAVTDIAQTTATGNGNVTDDGGATITERGVCWNTTGTPTTSDSKATSAGTTGAFTASMTGLTSSTLYYVRAYAINSEGTSYGSQVEVTTAAPPAFIKQQNGRLLFQENGRGLLL